jgi:hypothetical protein
MNGASGEAMGTTVTMIRGDETIAGEQTIPGEKTMHGDESAEGVEVLRQRAQSLRETATNMHELVAQAYRRRASELEMQAWLTELRAGCMVGPVAA